MQNSTTILGIIEMRLKSISYDVCCNRFGVGHRYRAKGVPLEVLKQVPGQNVVNTFYPPSNIRRKSEDIMPDYIQFCHYFNQYVNTTMGLRTYVWRWSGFRENVCISTGSVTNLNF